MFVTAVCLLFLTRGLIVFINVKLVRVSQLRPVTADHNDVADCCSCGCIFQRGLQHHAESRDHPMYYLSRIL